MRLSILAAGTALLLCSTAAMAQTNTPMTAPNASPAATNLQQPADQNSSTHGSLRAEVRDMLQKQGFSDIRVMPSSFIIRAKDKDGNPVVMNVSPDSITEIAEVGGSAGSDESANGTMHTNGAAEFVSVPNADDLSSNLIGLDVYNNANQNVGQIKDIAMNQHGRAQAFIVSVGGFLGLGQHYVAVNPNDIKVSYNDSDKKWHATMNATSAQLKNAPEFKYSGRWNASKS